MPRDLCWCRLVNLKNLEQHLCFCSYIHADNKRLHSIVQTSLQKYMRCKSGCFRSLGPDQPAEVVDEAPTSLVRIILGLLFFLIFLDYCYLILYLAVQPHAVMQIKLIMLYGIRYFVHSSGYVVYAHTSNYHSRCHT